MTDTATVVPQPSDGLHLERAAIIVQYLASCGELGEPEFTDAAITATLIMQRAWLSAIYNDSAGVPDVLAQLARLRRSAAEHFPDLDSRFRGRAAELPEGLLAPTIRMIADWCPGFDDVKAAAAQLNYGADPADVPTVVDLAVALREWHRQQTAVLTRQHSGRRNAGFTSYDCEQLGNKFEVLYTYGPFDVSVISWERLSRRWAERTEESRRRKEAPRRHTDGQAGDVGANEAVPSGADDCEQHIDGDADDPAATELLAEDVQERSDAVPLAVTLEAALPDGNDLQKQRDLEQLWERAFASVGALVTFEQLCAALHKQVKLLKDPMSQGERSTVLVALEALAIHGVRHFGPLAIRAYNDTASNSDKDLYYRVGRLLLADPVYGIVTNSMEADLRLAEINDPNLRQWLSVVTSWQQEFVDLGRRTKERQPRTDAFVYVPGTVDRTGRPVLTNSFTQWARRNTAICDLYVSTIRRALT